MIAAGRAIYSVVDLCGCGQSGAERHVPDDAGGSGEAGGGGGRVEGRGRARRGGGATDGGAEDESGGLRPGG